MTTEAAIQALHAVISRRPHSILVQKNVDAYFQFATAVERAANAVRDAYEIERQERMAP